MKTLTKNTKEGASTQNNFATILVIILLAILNMAMATAQNNPVDLRDDSVYFSQTTIHIKSNLSGIKDQNVALDGIVLQSAQLISSFYALNSFQPAWTVGNKLTKQAIEIIDMFKNSYMYGIEPIYFDIDALDYYANMLQKEVQSKKSAKIRARFEFLITNSLFVFLSNITKGSKYSNSKNYFSTDNSLVSIFPKYLFEIQSASDIKQKILDLQPKNKEYMCLQNEMQTLVLNMVITDNEILVPDIDKAPTACHNLISCLIIGMGITSSDINLCKPELFTGALCEIQNKLGLRATGKIDNATRRAISNIARNRYAELANLIEKIRHEHEFEENSTIASIL